ncbi:putative glycolate oxidase iron-sulfur subunit [Halobacillus andaensis]|uniref:Glycolate oxidase iron-sulfur subunit n=1 Tax=Halobacillus andaensis TaxID=1176239 RepID=A0A917BBZ8_HALAA|nr:(Fe-S)-binding protein [Halobacillus andaensis]MBP2006308.1 glycolate oxidase iron-sulfur subunit [Halobacillus andaensis]GGF34157.1 putative glycolate oxidase iron-sulfur subunit [Halobacillus andaensis]
MNSLEHLQEKVNYDKIFDCVQCGYCLPACPTYETMERETHSPRGRINLVKMVAEGKASVEDLRDPIEKCLGCMACTTVCPTNVQYGQILEGAKEVIEEHDVKSMAQKKVEAFLFESFFPSSNWMGTLGNATWLYQKSGIQKFVQTTYLTALAPMRLGRFERVLPDLPSPFERAFRKRRVLPDYKLRTTVAFFTGCVMDGIFFKTNQHTVELLRLAGAEVLLPKEQTCCGALHSHSGKGLSAKELAMTNIEAFDLEDVDYIVNNAGGCGAKMTEYPHLFEQGTEWHERAKEFAAKVRDISEVLVELDGLTFTTPVPRTVTYQPSCHMTNVQRVSEPPRMLLNNIPGLKVKELNRPDFCCGSAGIYNLVNYDESMEILDLKMIDVIERKPNAIITTNPGCLLQMKLGVERHGLEGEMEAMHLVDLLMEAEPAAK